jgi:hypothetical protein
MLLAMALTISSPRYIPVSTLISGNQGATERAVGDMLSGIISFTHWPVANGPRRVCLAGAARFFEARPDGTNWRGLPIRTLHASAPSEQTANQCDILYLAELPPGSNARLLAAVRGHPILTVAEDDPTCRSGAMFCLHVGPGEVAFELNLDAVSRSGVTVDPRVLRLSRGYRR